MLELKIENGYQVIALAKVLDEYIGANEFSNVVYNVIKKNFIDFNDSEKYWFKMYDNLNCEFTRVISRLGEFGLRNKKCWNDIKHVLNVYSGLQWRAYKYCFDDGLYYGIKKTFKPMEKFNNECVEVFESEVAELNVEGCEKLVDYFRNEIANSVDLAEGLYNYNMFALIFSYINDVRKGW